MSHKSLQWGFGLCFFNERLQLSGKINDITFINPLSGIFRKRFNLPLKIKHGKGRLEGIYMVFISQIILKKSNESIEMSWPLLCSFLC